MLLRNLSPSLSAICFENRASIQILKVAVFPYSDIPTIFKIMFSSQCVLKTRFAIDDGDLVLSSRIFISSINMNTFKIDALFSTQILNMKSLH